MRPRHLGLGESVGSQDAWIEAIFLSDLHLQTHRNAEAKFSSAIDRILADTASPDLIILGGDTVMNTVTSDFERANSQWEIWDRCSERFASIPLLAAIGNQDTWGWNRKESGCRGDEPKYGKALAIEHLGMEASSGIYKLGGWNAIVLDPIEEGGRYGFTSAVSKDQLCRIKDLIEVDPSAPLVVLCHLPPVPTPGDFQSLELVAPNSKGEWTLPGNQILSNGYELLQVMRQGSGTRVFLSGHTHMPQAIQFLGVQIITGAAICGAWWRGDVAGTKPGYSILRLGPKGEFEFSFVDLDYSQVTQ